jgi:hypothetical protein
MSSLNYSSFSSTKYYQKINKIRLSEVFFLRKCFVLPVRNIIYGS